MSNLFKWVIIGLVGYGAFVLVEPYWNKWRNPEPPVVQEKPRETTRKITCPTCSGEGRLTYVDRRGHNHTYACPICGFHGSTTINPPPGANVCPDCRGMGKTEIRKSRPDVVGPIITASRCQRCNAAGWILPRAAPGSQAPTPAVRPPAPAR